MYPDHHMHESFNKSSLIIILNIWVMLNIFFSVNEFFDKSLMLDIKILVYLSKRKKRRKKKCKHNMVKGDPNQKLKLCAGFFFSLLLF